MSFVDEVHVRLPSTWSASNAGQSAQTVSVDVGAERDKVEAAFMRTMTEVHVLRIQNAKMWNLFAVKRQSVLVREAGADNAQAMLRFDRRWLFHAIELIKIVHRRLFHRGLTAPSAAKT